MLTFDLFELIDRMFRGIVYFIYNILTSLGRIAAKPIRGPAQLYRMHRQVGISQVSGITLLFVTSFITQSLIIPGIDASNGVLIAVESHSDSLNSIALDMKVDVFSFWPAIAASLALTIVFDIVLRGFCLILAGRQGRRRDYLVGVLQYALVPPVLATALAFLLVALGIRDLMFSEWGVLWLAAACLVIYVSVIPAATIMVCDLSANRAKRRRLLALLLAFALGAAVTTVSLACAQLGAQIAENSYDRKETRRQARISNVSCQLVENERIELVALISGGAGEPIAIDMDRLKLIHSTLDTETTNKAQTSLPAKRIFPDTQYLVAHQGSGEIVKVYATPSRPPTNRDSCGLSFSYGREADPVHLRLPSDMSK